MDSKQSTLKQKLFSVAISYYLNMPYDHRSFKFSCMLPKKSARGTQNMHVTTSRNFWKFCKNKWNSKELLTTWFVVNRYIKNYYIRVIPQKCNVVFMHLLTTVAPATPWFVIICFSSFHVWLWDPKLTCPTLHLVQFTTETIFATKLLWRRTNNCWLINWQSLKVFYSVISVL